MESDPTANKAEIEVMKTKTSKGKQTLRAMINFFTQRMKIEQTYA